MEAAGACCRCARGPVEEAPEGGGGGGCGERCGRPGPGAEPASAEGTDAAYRSVSQALQHLQEVIGHLDAKVEGTRRAIHGIKHSIREKRHRVDGLHKRMDDVERRLLFDTKLKEFFRPFADCVVPTPPTFPMLPVPPPVYSSISTSTSDLPSSGSEAMAFDSSLSCLRSFSLASDSAHAPVSIAISIPNSPAAAQNGDLRDSTVILRFIPVSNSDSTHSAAPDTMHQNSVLRETNSHRSTACLTDNRDTYESRTCGKGTSTEKSPSPNISSVSTNESSFLNFHSAHKTRSVLSPISARETNSNYTTSTVHDYKSVHDSMPSFRSKSTLKLCPGSHVPNDESTSAPKFHQSPIFVPQKASMENCESIHKFKSSPLAQVNDTPLFTSTPNLIISTSNSTFPLDSKITPTFIPTCASESSCPPVPIPSCISCSSPASPPSSSFASIVNYSSSFLSGMERPSGWRSLLIQTVSSTVRPLTVHSSRVMSDEDERDDRPASAPRRSALEPSPPPPPTTSGDETDSMCAIEYIALPHFQRSAFAQTDAFRAPSGAPAAVASLPSLFRHEARAPGGRAVRVSRSTPIQSQFAFTGHVTSVGVCTSKPVISVQAATSNPASVAVATSVSRASVPLMRTEYHLLTGKTLTLLGKELLKASYEGRAADVELILRAGVHVDYTCGSTWTPLHRASWGGHEGVVALLLRRGADVRATTAFGFTALHIAAYNDPGGECVRLLIDAGAELDARNRLGWTPLHYAAEGGRSAAVGALVKAGASAMVRSARGKTPFHVTRSLKIRQLLLTGHDDSLIPEEDEQEIEVS